MKDNLQKYLDVILGWPGNFVHVYGYGLLMVKFKVNGEKYEIIFDENLEVQIDLSDCGNHLKESGEFYKTNDGCTFSVRAPENWIFMHIFETSRKRNANGSSPTSVGSDQCRKGS